MVAGRFLNTEAASRRAESVLGGLLRAIEAAFRPRDVRVSERELTRIERIFAKAMQVDSGGGGRGTEGSGLSASALAFPAFGRFPQFSAFGYA